jgi:hypothetical protein
MKRSTLAILFTAVVGLNFAACSIGISGPGPGDGGSYYYGGSGGSYYYGGSGGSGGSACLDTGDACGGDYDCCSGGCDEYGYCF